MKKITQEELNNKIELHKEWLEDDNKGEKLELNGYNLRNLDLSNSDLRYSSLSCSILSNVDLSYSDLSFSTLKDADLVKMDLTKAIISFSNLENIDLYGANLDSSYLRCVDFKNAILKNANLDNAHLENCNLEDVNLSQANTRCIEGLEVYSIDNIGTFAGKVTYLPEQDKVFAGCWKGNLEEFLEKGLEMNKDNEKEKRNIFNAYQFFLGTTID